MAYLLKILSLFKQSFQQMYIRKYSLIIDICRLFFIYFLLLTYSINSYSSSTPSKINKSKNHFIDKTIADAKVLEHAAGNDDNNHFHLFSHGKSGELLIEGEWKNASKIENWFAEKNLLNNHIHLNIYGCEFGKGKKGEAAISYLENTLSISIAASDDITGIDGDWDLEIGTSNSPLKFEQYAFNLQCDCDEYIYLNETTDGGKVHKFLINSNGTVTEVLNNGQAWYPGNGTSEMESPHGLGSDLNGYLYIAEGLGTTHDIRKLTCDGDIFSESDFAITHPPTNLETVENTLYAVHNLENGIYHYDLCSGNLLGTTQLQNSNDPDFRNQDWGFSYNATTETFYATHGFYGDINESYLYRWPLSDMTVGTTIPVFLSDCSSTSFVSNGDNCLSEAASILGVQGDNNGNIYIIEKDFEDNHPARIVKYNSSGVVVATTAWDNNDGDGGWHGAIGIEYSQTTGFLYVSTVSPNDDCVSYFDANLNYLGAAVPATGSGSEAKGIALQLECCPTPADQTIHRTFCTGARTRKVFLNRFFPCDGVICGAPWEPADSESTAVYSDCDQSVAANIAPGCYTYTKNSNSLNGCGVYSLELIIEVFEDPGLSISSDQTACPDDFDPLTINITNTNNPSLSYQWQSSTTNCTSGFTDIVGAPTDGSPYTPASLSTTTYFRVVAKNADLCVPSSCSATSNCVTLTVDTGCGPVCSISGTDPDCGIANGSATVSGTDGTPPYTYSWSNSGSGSLASNLGPGSYTVTITDANNATSTCNIVLTEPGGPSATCMVDTQPGCGQANGSASVSASGGSTPYSYVWSSGGSNASESGLAAGMYTVTITDANSCSTTCDITLTEPGGPSATCSADTNPSCFMADGQISTSVSGGTPPYTYSWSSGGSGATATGLVGGNYTLTVTDANNCTATCAIILPDPTGCCEVSISTTTQSECRNNGTPTNVNDDYFTLTVNATNTSPTLTQFEVVYNAAPDGTGGTVIGTSNYNTPIVVGTASSPPLQADGSSTYTITVRDATTPTCFETFTTTPVDYCFTCPTFNMVTTSDSEICDGESVATIQAAVTDVVGSDQVRFVYFTSPQFGTAVYTGGTHIGTVPATAGFASISNISFPSAGSYFVYAILDPPSTADPSCRPFAFTEITVHPLPNNTMMVQDISTCEDHAAVISLYDSELRVSYQLRDDINDNPIGESVRGNGRDILIYIPPVSTAGIYTYNIYATNTATGCEQEVLDKVVITVEECDFPFYRRECDSPPCHFVRDNLYFGTDIMSGSDNGVLFANDIHPGNLIHLPINIFNNTANDAYMTAWVDWNADNDFDDAGEQVANETYIYATYNGNYQVSLPVNVPNTVSQGNDINFRFRLSTDQAAIADPCSEVACAPDGEIEDYLLRIDCNNNICLPISIRKND